MKPIYILTIALMATACAYGQQTTIDSKDIQPEFKGGIPAFSAYITNNITYPKVAGLIGIDGQVMMQFIVNEEGKVVEAVPLNCIGAGCEAEASKVLLNSPRWKPGIQKGKPVRVQYTLPISFNMRKAMITMKELRRSNYGFLFLIKDKEYSIDQAEEVLGKEFMANTILIAEEQYDDQHKVAGKKATYLLKIDG